ncbi:hypothetical protein [Microbacterium esteraromaticum]|nr:hypothetical protein [Microbacterium esteraromaticum]
MGYRIFDRTGRLVGGDDELDGEVRRAAADVDGYVLDDADKVVFDARGV